MEFIHTLATAITVGQHLTLAAIAAMCENLWVGGLTLLGVYLLIRLYQHF